MKKIYLLVISFSLLFPTLYAQDSPCVPDSTVGDTVGIYPAFLEDGNVGQPYEQVINIVVPETITVNNFSASICSFQVDSIPNLPEGLTFACNGEDCQYTIDHKDEALITRACAVVQGTPTGSVLPDDSLDVYVSVSAGLLNTFNDCVAFPDGVVDPSLTRILFRVGLQINSATSIKNPRSESIAVGIFPNPSDGNSQVRFELEEWTDVKVEVRDLIGRKVQTVIDGRLPAGNVQREIESGNLSSGIYLLRFSFNQGEKVLTRKWILRK